MSVQSPKKKPFDGFTLTLIFIVLAVAVSVPLRAPSTSKAETARDSNEAESRVELTEPQTELDADLQELEERQAELAELAEYEAESRSELIERQTELDAELQKLEERQAELAEYEAELRAREEALAAIDTEPVEERDHEYLEEDIQELREEVHLLQRCMLDIYRILEEYSAEHSNVLP